MQSVRIAKCTVMTNCWIIVHYTIKHFSPAAADEVIERVDSARDLEENESSSVGSSDSEEDEPDDPQVQEKVGSRYDGISNSTEICDFL